MLSHRIAKVMEPPLVDLMRAANESDGCISLAQGVPSYSPPVELLKQFSEEIVGHDIHSYTADPGIPRLRKGVSQLLNSDFSMKTHEEEIVITPGANQAFVNVLLTLTSPGNKVLLLSPYYFNHLMACELFDLEVIVHVLTRDFRINYDSLRQQILGVKVLVLVNPGNPTGYSLNSRLLGELADFLHEVAPDVWVISDETYNYFSYEFKHVPMRHYYEKTITLGSFSKSFGIPGWRLGYYHATEEVVSQSLKVQDTSIICAPHPSQILGCVLLENRSDFLDGLLDVTRSNYLLAKEFVSEVPWLETTPHNSAYYLFPRSNLAATGFRLALSLIREHKVAVVPGEVFGTNWNDHLRISFANVSTELLVEGFNRLKRVRL